MGLTAAQLLNVIEGTPHHFLGSGQTEIYEVTLWHEGESLRPGALFLTSQQNLPLEPTACILSLQQKDMFSVFAQLQAVLAQDYRRSSALSKLGCTLSKEPVIEELIALCQDVMSNPIYLLDGQFHVIAGSDGDQMRHLYPAVFDPQNAPFGLRFSHAGADSLCPYSRHFGTIYHDGVLTGYLLVFSKDRRDFSDLDQNYLGHLCSLLAILPHLKISKRMMSASQQLVLDLLQGRITDPDVIRQRFSDLNWKEEEKYYVLSIQAEPLQADATETIQKELSRRIKLPVYTYEHYFVAILGCDTHININQYMFPELLSYLAENKLFAGLSKAFVDLSTFRQAFEQSIIVVQLRSKLNDPIPFARYEDSTLIHLLDIANRSGVPLFSLCHPVVNQIYQYDLANDTEYLKPLTAYIYNNLALQQTANVLFVHRNTLYHRINLLKDLFNIDFTSPRLLMKLWLSVSIYTYFDIVHARDLLGPMF